MVLVVCPKFHRQVNAGLLEVLEEDLRNGQPHDYIPDVVIRLVSGSSLILETKGFDDLADVKAAAAERWMAAVNADGQFGAWRCAIARSVLQMRERLEGVTVAGTRG